MAAKRNCEDERNAERQCGLTWLRNHEHERSAERRRDTCVHTYTHTRTHIYMHNRTYIHTRMHTYTSIQTCLKQHALFPEATLRNKSSCSCVTFSGSSKDRRLPPKEVRAYIHIPKYMHVACTRIRIYIHTYRNNVITYPHTYTDAGTH